MRESECVDVFSVGERDKSLIFVWPSGADEPLDPCEGHIEDCNCSLPSIGLSIMSPIVETEVDCGL